MSCRVCDSKRLELAIDLGQQPWCNHFLKPEQVGKEPFYPLRVVYCHDCHTAQLDFTVEEGDHVRRPHLPLGRDPIPERTFPQRRQRGGRPLLQRRSRPLVLDIGSNDGTQLKHFQALGYDVLGVESSKTTARIAQDAGVPTLNTFFNLEVVRNLGRKFHVINAAGVFFHLEELHSVTEGIREALRPDGVFVVQFLYMKRIVDNLAFDQIYHEHLLYYNLETIQKLLARHGLAMFDAYVSPIHGGSDDRLRDPRRQARRIRPLARAAKTAEVDAHSNDFATYLKFARPHQADEGRKSRLPRPGPQPGQTHLRHGRPRQRQHAPELLRDRQGH